MIVQFSVTCTPRPQTRPRLSHRHAFEPSFITEYKRLIRALGHNAMHGTAPLNGSLSIELNIRRNKKIDSRAFGDIDNHIKSVLDALNGVCYVDDSQIAVVHVRKFQSKNEGIDILLTDDFI